MWNDHHEDISILPVYHQAFGLQDHTSFPFTFALQPHPPQLNPPTVPNIIQPQPSIHHPPSTSTSTSQHHPPPNPQKTPTMPLLARRFSITNFIIASSALGFQVSVLYPWHMKLDEDFAALRKENVRLAKLVEQKFRIGAAASLEGKEEKKGKVEGKA
ncbi:unnamed protein product [Zymoseptoria tritici ST99CH_3D1]|nr:unnamed protein product [Zymoseptoria tritici ST99CH_3D1]